MQKVKNSPPYNSLQNWETLAIKLLLWSDWIGREQEPSLVTDSHGNNAWTIPYPIFFFNAHNSYFAETI